MTSVGQPSCYNLPMGFNERIQTIVQEELAKCKDEQKAREAFLSRWRKDRDSHVRPLLKEAARQLVSGGTGVSEADPKRINGGIALEMSGSKTDYSLSYSPDATRKEIVCRAEAGGKELESIGSRYSLETLTNDQVFQSIKAFIEIVLRTECGIPTEEEGLGIYWV